MGRTTYIILIGATILLLLSPRFFDAGKTYTIVAVFGTMISSIVIHGIRRRTLGLPFFFPSLRSMFKKEPADKEHKQPE